VSGRPSPLPTARRCATPPLSVFLSYSHRDRLYRDRLKVALAQLRRDGLITEWDDQMISAGDEWDESIQHALASAELVLLLISPDFIASNYSYDNELAKALARDERGDVRIIPIIVRPADWHSAPFAHLQALPTGARAVTEWSNRDRAWADIAAGIRRVVSEAPMPSATEDEDDELDTADGTDAEDDADARAAATLSPEDRRGDADDDDADARAAATLSPEERRDRIVRLLPQAPGNTVDDLPKGLLALLVEPGDIRLLEDSLVADAPYMVAANAIQAIGLRADWEWTDPVVKSATSVERLMAYYGLAPDLRLRIHVIDALFKFDATEIPFDFLVERLAQDVVPIKAEVLGSLQFFVQKPYLRDLMDSQVLPLLHEFCTWPLRDSMYTSTFFGEQDFRYWVFRCLGGIGNAQSAPVIERYLEVNDWPLATLAEAVNAHWDITGSTRYIDVLRRAEAEGELGNTEHALAEMRQALGETEPASD
jgi:hypothetical protein